MHKVLIISNPSSGQKKSSSFVDSLNDLFQSKSIMTSVYQTHGDDDFGSLISDHMDKGYDTVAVLGGDGTVSELVNEIAGFEIRPNILVIPLGSTNNLARALGSELDENQILSKIADNQLVEQKIDIGKLNEKYFVSTVSVGSIPETAWKTDDELKEKFGAFGYILEGLQVLNEQKSFDVSIKTDRESLKIQDVFIIVLGLSNSVFGIPTFFEQAKLDDGQIYMYILKHSDVLSEVGSLARQILPSGEKNYR